MRTDGRSILFLVTPTSTVLGLKSADCMPNRPQIPADMTGNRTQELPKPDAGLPTWRRTILIGLARS